MNIESQVLVPWVNENKALIDMMLKLIGIFLLFIMFTRCTSKNSFEPKLEICAQTVQNELLQIESPCHNIYFIEADLAKVLVESIKAKIGINPETESDIQTLAYDLFTHKTWLSLSERIEELDKTLELNFTNNDGDTFESLVFFSEGNKFTKDTNHTLEHNFASNECSLNIVSLLTEKFTNQGNSIHITQSIGQRDLLLNYTILNQNGIETNHVIIVGKCFNYGPW
ncbi:MAG: hypothetical protein GQ574_12525 [Crocinitomix sp.]|nr:hypothetical protein [Crocinitomix sp.]